MPALASCYFCGEAVGASLDEYDLPEDAPADDQVTVTLCARCEGKLSELLEELALPAAEQSAAPVFEADSSTGAADALGESPAPESAADTESDVDASDADDRPSVAATRHSDDAQRGSGDSSDADRPNGSSQQDDDEGSADPDESAGADDPDASEDSPAPIATDSAADPDLDTVAGEQEPIFADEDDPLDDEPDDAADASEQFDAVSAPFGESTGQDAASDTADTDSGADAATDSTDPDDPEEDPIAAPPASESAADSEGPSDDGQAEADPASEPVRDPEPDSEDGDQQEDIDDASAAETGAVGAESEDGEEAAERTAAAVEVGAGGAGTASRGASAATGNDATESTTGPLADVSPRTYNRVVRLLQNREFPVDRADFEALATSAYELDHGECAAALDGAIEKGLLEERGGELHRPE